MYFKKIFDSIKRKYTWKNALQLNITPKGWSIS